MRKTSPEATKLLNKLSTEEKEAIKTKVTNPVAAVKYVVKTYSVGLRVAKELVDTFR